MHGHCRRVFLAAALIVITSTVHVQPTDLRHFARHVRQAVTSLLNAIIVAACCSAGAWALPADYSVPELYQTRWTVREGVPTGIAAMAQTPDGFLWIGAPGGLFRFDGVEFERFLGTASVPLLSQDIYAMNVSADGALWIGHHLGGISRFHRGVLVNYGVEQGLPRSSVSALSEDGDGVIWAGTTRGLYRLDRDGRWHAVNTAWGLPPDPVDAMVLDRDRTLWVMANNHGYQLKHGASRFETLGFLLPHSGFNDLTLHPDGSAMFCGGTRVISLTPSAPTAGRHEVPRWTDRPVDIGENRCAFDRNGQLWFGGPKSGGRFPAAPRTPASHSRPELPEPVSLPTGVTTRVLEDREGNIWISTRSGLERIRAPALRKLALDPEATEFAIVPAGERGAWIGTSRGSIVRAYPGAQERIRTDPQFGIGIDILYADPAGSLWAAVGDSIWQRQPDQRWRRSARKPAAMGRDGYVYSSIEAMTQDRQGAMWVSVLRVGVYRVIGDQWTLWGGRKDMPSHNVTALFTDPLGRVWFGYDDGLVTVLDGDQLTTVVRPDASPASASIGEVSVFVQQGSSLWIGGQNGLWRLDEERRLQAVQGLRGAFAGVTGVVPTITGDLWLSTVEGVVCLGADELERSREQPGHHVRYELLNYLDGLPGVPDGAVGNNGRIWFATVDGVVWIDPTQRPRNPIAPTVVVKSIVADGSSYPVSSSEATRLPLRVRDLKISFTAPSLTMPERVHFRYRLSEAGDQKTAWQDVGNRHEVYFKDLAPGHYRFEVTAANNDERWSVGGASVEVIIPPAFVQTRWFVALCVIAAIAVLRWFYLLRMRAANDSLRLRLEERMVERERIARELHDTFLQAVQGLMLRFHSAMERIPRHEPARDMMESALDSADDVIGLGRDAVLNLREPAATTIDLAADLQMVGERWSRDTGIAFSANVQGDARELGPVALQECQRLACEALSNAFRHAEAANVWLEVVYTPRTFTLRIEDNGHGFDTTARPVGRWGLVGMRERAARLGAALEVRSHSRGTSVCLRVPARSAYRRKRWHWLRKAPGDLA